MLVGYHNLEILQSDWLLLTRGLRCDKEPALANELRAPPTHVRGRMCVEWMGVGALTFGGLVKVMLV